MAAYIQLFPIGYTSAATFQSIDNAICQALELPWDDDKYVSSWYDIIAFRLALGQSFDQITDWLNEMIVKTDHQHYYTLLRINHFLLENYTTEAWFAH